MSRFPFRTLQGTQANGPAASAGAALKVSARLQIASIVLRSIFILALLFIIIRVSLPQNETLWTAWDTPADLIRVFLGLVACVWMTVQLFVLPKDAHAYRTWLYLGLTALPFALVCLYFVW
jgi:hypothetical protein